MNTKMYNKGTNNNNNNNSTTSNLNISISTSSSNGQASANSPGGSSTTATTTTTDRIEWSRATILDFIEDYRCQRVLWDPNTKGYHIKQTKYEALKALGYKYGAEIRSIRSKIKSLRSSFHREHGKVLNGRRKGLNYQPMWFAYDAIRFILDGEAGDSDYAETLKNESNTTRETILIEPNNNNNNNNNQLIKIDEELMEERKISSRDIEHFNNHFLALGLQARHPMAVIAAVEAAAAATAAQERRQEQENALRQQQQQIDAATQLKLLELTTNIVKNNKTNNNNNSNSNNDCTLTSTSTSQFNPISKSINSSKSTSPLPLVLPAPTSAATITTTSAVTITATPPPPFSTNTCSAENLNVLHGSRSLDENAALVAATAIPSLSITAVARNSDFDGSEYCNISADDVKTEIFESDSNELAMLESRRTSTPVPLNYHKNITDLSTSKSNTVGSNNSNIANISRSNINGVTGSRKRKLQMHSNVNLNHSSEDAPSPSKLLHKQVHHQQQQQQQQLQLQLQHSNAIHSRQCDYLNSNNHNININNINSNQSQHDNNNSTANNENIEDNEDDDDDGAGYSTSFSHLQTTLINAGNNSNGNGNGNGNTSGSSHNCKLNNGSNNSSAPIDEYGVFGEYVAITIRKLKASKAKIVVKHLINNLLYEAEMGKYDQGISSCKEPPELYKM